MLVIGAMSRHSSISLRTNISGLGNLHRRGRCCPICNKAGKKAQRLILVVQLKLVHNRDNVPSLLLLQARMRAILGLRREFCCFWLYFPLHQARRHTIILFPSLVFHCARFSRVATAQMGIHSRLNHRLAKSRKIHL